MPAAGLERPGVCIVSSCCKPEHPPGHRLSLGTLGVFAKFLSDAPPDLHHARTTPARRPAEPTLASAEACPSCLSSFFFNVSVCYVC